MGSLVSYLVALRTEIGEETFGTRSTPSLSSSRGVEALSMGKRGSRRQGQVTGATAPHTTSNQTRLSKADSPGGQSAG